MSGVTWLVLVGGYANARDAIVVSRHRSLTAAARRRAREAIAGRAAYVESEDVHAAACAGGTAAVIALAGTARGAA